MASDTDWSRLLGDAGVGAMVVDHDGRVLFINDAAARIFTKRPVGESRGLRLSEFLRPAAAEERLDITRRVLGAGNSVHFSELWSGVALRATVRRLESFAGTQGPAALWVYASENALVDMGPLEAPAGLVEARHPDLGRLAGLTVSELKVLALIGEGLSNSDIAARLRRAVKTVESHRAALTEKTGCAGRVELGMLARRAGLIRRVDIPPAASPAKASALPSFG